MCVYNVSDVTGAERSCVFKVSDVTGTEWVFVF